MGWGAQSSHAHSGSPVVLFCLKLFSEEPICFPLLILGRRNRVLFALVVNKVVISEVVVS